MGRALAPRIAMQLIKNGLKRLLWSRGKDIVSRPAPLARHPEASLELSLGLCLSALYLQRPDLIVVQVGAYDGNSGDPLHRFISRHQVRGILVEPQPLIFRRLQATYSGRTNLTLVNAAVTARD